ncbi:MAG: AarF/ABC1/UbiB kinase family protein [Sandaracinaceae bacterium]|nr:AarF/ABC1/UbiB kinase family protein [Sandaracinaceae bacterium]
MAQHGSDDDDPKTLLPTLDSLASGFRKRTAVTAKLAARAGLRAASRSVFGARQGEVDVQKAVEAARTMVTEMGQLKGLVMKAGQMASFLPGAMPEEAREIMAKLQSESAAMKYERVQEVVRAELGGEVDQLFEGFEQSPFAAASIGQVHRARVDGQPVAVKVQYPGIEALLVGDLDFLGGLASVFTLRSPMDGRALAKELRERTLEACDYVPEERHQQLFEGLLSTQEGCSVPAIVPSRSARRVLTTRLVDGMRFQPFVDTASQAARDRAGERIFRVAFDSLFRHGVYNGDPHPGNYLFGDEGQVTFLDFGCVRYYQVDFIDAWKRVAMAAQDGDFDTFKKRFPDLGMTPKPKKMDWEAQWDAMLQLYTPMRTRGPFFTFTHAYVEESYGKLVFDNPNKLKMAMPAEWLLLNRLQWGLFAVLSHLGSTAPWPDIFRAALEAPTRPVHLADNP